MKIFIPSYKRAGKVKTAELVPSAYIACHAFEAIEKAGGCGAYRLKSKEIEQAEIMKKRWGSLIKYDFNRSMNPTVRIPIKGI